MADETPPTAAANGGPFVRTSVGWVALGTGAAVDGAVATVFASGS